MELEKLDIYKLARKLSANAWNIFKKMDWETKNIMGYQWIKSIDSVGANIAEGHGRFHYLDKNKFNLNARASLLEATHWTELLKERNKISDDDNSKLFSIINELHPKLNKYISKTKELANK